MSIISSRRLLHSPLPISAPSPAFALDSLNFGQSTANPSLKVSSSSSSSNFDQGSSNFNGPYMGVVLVVLLVTFFLMAFFSVYVRRYAFTTGTDPATDGMADWTRTERMRGLDRTLIDRLPIVAYHCVEEEKRQARKGELSQEVLKLESNDARTTTTTTMKEVADTTCTTTHTWQRQPDCVVCLTDFEEDENVRLLPKCEHCFHPQCIDMWLFSHTTCPLCRRSLLPVPALTPASSTASGPAHHLLSPETGPSNDTCIDDVQGGAPPLEFTNVLQGGSMDSSTPQSGPS